MENTTLELIETKRCSKCGRELPVSMFNKSSKAATGYQSWCKECSSMANRHYNAAKKERKVKEADDARIKDLETKAITKATTDALVAELLRRKDFELQNYLPPRVMLDALKALGYRGALTVTVEQTVNL